jgi:hypothetical protein
MPGKSEPAPEQIAADIEQMLASLKQAAAIARGLRGIPGQLRLAAERREPPPPPRAASRPKLPAEAAAEIAGELTVLAAHAEFSGLPMLAYLIGVARAEAEARGGVVGG